MYVSFFYCFKFRYFSGNALIIMLHISYNIFFMLKLIQELRL